MDAALSFAFGAGLAAVVAYVGLSAHNSNGLPVPSEVKGFALVLVGGALYAFSYYKSQIPAIVFVPGSDVVTEWLPILTVGFVIGYLAWRCFIMGNGEPILSPAVTDGWTPGCIFALVGGHTCFVVYDAITTEPSTLTAWMPTLVLAAVTGLFAYRGQAAAGGADLRVMQLVGAVMVGVAVMSLLPSAAVAPEEPAAKGASLPFGLGKKKKADAQPKEPLPDPAADMQPLVLAVATALCVLMRVATRPKAEPLVPTALTGVKFPPALMCFLGVFTFDAIYKVASAQEGGFDTLVPLCGMAMVTGELAYIGTALQA